MAGRAVSLEEKIRQQETVVAERKEKYDAAVESLNSLVKKKRELESKELLKAFEKSSRSLEEVIEFLKGNDAEKE